MADTIAALATGGAPGAIGIVRLSGDRAIETAAAVFSCGVPVSSFENRKLYYGILARKGRVLDRCLCTVSRAPDSYTGEATAELQCHGSPLVLRGALDALFEAGARQALPGEFTKRAFLNGRLDLTQAEAVVDLISAETEEAAVNAAGQLGGAVSRKTDAVYDGLADIMAHFHAVLDYPDEDIDPFSLEAYAADLKSYATGLLALKKSFDRGRLMKNGVKSAIVGKPNAGKSSLLNALLGYDRAIVTDAPGTTRDTIEEKLRLGDVLLRLSDTAGLRHALDQAEKIGVERAVSAVREARLVLAVFDGSRALEEEDFQVINAARESPFPVALINKSDLPQKLDLSPIESGFENICHVSARTGAGLGKLEDTVAGLFRGEGPTAAGEILTNARHCDAVSRALLSVGEAEKAMTARVTPDAVLTEIEAAMSALGEITGRTVREDITARIFERFCVGK